MKCNVSGKSGIRFFLLIFSFYAVEPISLRASNDGLLSSGKQHTLLSGHVQKKDSTKKIIIATIVAASVIAAGTIFFYIFRRGIFNGVSDSKRLVYSDSKNLAVSIQDSQQASMLAAALGDALGRVTEFEFSMESIFKKYPNGVTGLSSLVPSDWQGIPASLNNVLVYTDDTAMAVLVAQVLAEDAKMSHTSMQQDELERVMGNIADKFVEDMDNDYGWLPTFRAPGGMCKRACYGLKGKMKNKILDKNTKGWWIADRYFDSDGGCGSVMRAHPFGLVYYQDPNKAALFAAEHSKITHGDPSALASCAAMAMGVACNVQKMDPDIVVENMIKAATKYGKNGNCVDTNNTAYRIKIARDYAIEARKLIGPNVDILALLKDSGSDFRKMHEKVFGAHNAAKKKEEHVPFYGWGASDAIAGAVYLYYLFPDNPMNAIMCGVHAPGDSDSIASMAGALIGARTGMMSLPIDLINRIESVSEIKKVLN